MNNDMYKMININWLQYILDIVKLKHYFNFYHNFSKYPTSPTQTEISDSTLAVLNLLLGTQPSSIKLKS